MEKPLKIVLRAFSKLGNFIQENLLNLGESKESLWRSSHIHFFSYCTPSLVWLKFLLE